MENIRDSQKRQRDTDEWTPIGRIVTDVLAQIVERHDRDYGPESVPDFVRKQLEQQQAKWG